MNLITYITGRKSRKEFIADIKDLNARCEKLSEDLKHNADIYARELNLANDEVARLNAELQKAKDRYAFSERASQEYLDRAERVERKYSELEAHLNSMYKEYESFRNRLNRRDA